MFSIVIIRIARAFRQFEITSLPFISNYRYSTVQSFTITKLLPAECVHCKWCEYVQAQ